MGDGIVNILSSFQVMFQPSVIITLVPTLVSNNGNIISGSITFDVVPSLSYQ